jgi:hypothetical protein
MDAPCIYLCFANQGTRDEKAFKLTGATAHSRRLSREQRQKKGNMEKNKHKRVRVSTGAVWLAATVYHPERQKSHLWQVEFVANF